RPAHAPEKARCRRDAARRQDARCRPPARPPPRQAVRRRAPAGRDRAGAADGPATPAARRAARFARCRPQGGDHAVPRAPARRGRADDLRQPPGRGHPPHRRLRGADRGRPGQGERRPRAPRRRGCGRDPMSFPPERIVCLTEETVETLYLLGEDRRIVGVSGYAVRPPRVRREKPRVSAFISADFAKILALDPDLVLTFSDLQADIVAELIRRGVAVHAFNQRDLAGILAMIRTLGALLGATEKAEHLCDDLQARLEEVRAAGKRRDRHPRIYFEEWDDPMISGIGWVSELIAAAGGIDVFAARASNKSASERIASAEE